MPYTRFGIWLDRQLQERAIPSQSELARRIGETPSTVNRWMNGVTEPDYRQVRTLAKALEVPNWEVFAALGYLPDLTDEDLQEVKELWATADSRERETILLLARGVLRDKLDPTSDDQADPRSG